MHKSSAPSSSFSHIGNASNARTNCSHINADVVHSLTHDLGKLVSWWRGVAATRCVESTKFLYGGPG